MQFKLVLFVLLFVLFSASPQTSDLKTAIDKSDFVAFVYRTMEVESTIPLYNTVMVYKGSCEYVADKNGLTNIEDKGIYLLIGSVTNYELNTLNYPLTNIDDLPEAVLQILQELPCYDEAVKANNEHGVCHRVFQPVCGCDNETHGNICEMLKKGIVKFKPGPCTNDGSRK